ncbi:hypothetical protein BSL78_05087 [Apostichopus japonicus]|uniref:V-SNARE coiled-coil homology domain-containing protein n=1 Tax=Stichopus japonicus TaxID=307972 RepID=A0A2G8LCM0_STIJA|nr:hypothetical protein BSL78_05087 [Apostichopus japonicus]
MAHVFKDRANKTIQNEYKSASQLAAFQKHSSSIGRPKSVLKKGMKALKKVKKRKQSPSLGSLPPDLMTSNERYNGDGPITEVPVGSHQEGARPKQQSSPQSHVQFSSELHERLLPGNVSQVGSITSYGSCSSDSSYEDTSGTRTTPSIPKNGQNEYKLRRKDEGTKHKSPNTKESDKKTHPCKRAWKKASKLFKKREKSKKRKTNPSLAELQQQTEEVAAAMRENGKRILQRGEHIDTLMARADSLNKVAETFQKNTREIPAGRCCIWKSIRNLFSKCNCCTA